MEASNTNNFELLSLIIKQNETILEQNAKLNLLLEKNKNEMEDKLRVLEEQNKKQNDENSKIFSYFTTEFIVLKRSIDRILKEVEIKNNIYSLETLRSTQEVLQFDEKLKEDLDLQNLMLRRLKNQPHDNIKTFIFENLKLIFQTDEVITTFSWHNMYQNTAVKDMYFIRLLKDAALEHIPGTMGSTIETQIKHFLIRLKIDLTNG
ncbi:uncharacterized protein LOC131803448 [Musca domestica]|uniref:Uncharacterized protein LOC131803448 n=1 Tax=Musca domestica TaxID=7370 RepID=A0ABM3V4S8_MUSDO|nr:uncharacterized protein LOC131803448 [Musca domestica]